MSQIIQRREAHLNLWEYTSNLLSTQQLLHGQHEFVTECIQHLQVVSFRVNQFTYDKVALLKVRCRSSQLLWSVKHDVISDIARIHGHAYNPKIATNEQEHIIMQTVTNALEYKVKKQNEHKFSVPEAG